MYNEKIGIVGGFGGYATLDFYQKFLKEFASDCERNYPYIIFDNNFTMPSRTRALLYNESYNEVVNDIAHSVKKLCDQQVSYIILVCGTAHAFLNDIYTIVPEAKNKILNIVEYTAKKISMQGISKTLVIAAEGALKKNIYENYLKQFKIEAIAPSENDFKEIRRFIESVKQNNIDTKTADDFLDFLDLFETKSVILGCTEFPTLVEYISTNGSVQEKARLNKYHFFDPLHIVLNELKKILH